MSTEPNWTTNELKAIKRVTQNGEYDSFNLTEIHNAIAQDDVNILINLLKNNKDNKIDINAKSQNGYTALMLAADKDTEHLKILLDAGADIHLRDSRLSTALYIAITSLNNPVKNLQLLIDRGAQCNDFNGLRDTPLSKACFNAQNQSLELNAAFDILLKYSDVTLVKDKENPLLVALFSDNLDKEVTKECIYKICAKAYQDEKLDLLEKQLLIVKENYLISKWCEDYFYKTTNSIRLHESLDKQFNSSNEPVLKVKKKI